MYVHKLFFLIFHSKLKGKILHQLLLLDHTLEGDKCGAHDKTVFRKYRLSFVNMPNLQNNVISGNVNNVE